MTSLGMQRLKVVQAAPVDLEALTSAVLISVIFLEIFLAISLEEEDPEGIVMALPREAISVPV